MTETTPAKKRKKARLARTLLITLAVLVIIRLCLPFIVLHFVNKKLASLDGYYGHVNDIDLAIYRGAYVMKDIYINKVDSSRRDSTEFFRAQRIDLSVEWKALFKGKIVGEVEFKDPVLIYTMDKTIGKKAEKDSTDFIQLVKDFMPLKINRFAVQNGQIHYTDKNTSPLVDVPLTAVNIEGRGLTNKPEKEGTALPAAIEMSGKLYDGGININVKLDPLNKIPTFDLNGNLSKTNLVHMNNFFRAYGNFDLQEGNMSMYTEFAARNNEFSGYVKPFIMDLDVVQFNKEEGDLKQIAWEAFVGSVAEIFQNQRKEQLAAKVTVEGRFTQPDVKVLDAVLSLLKNAFIQALQPYLENSINLYNIGKQEEKKGLGKRLFDKDKKDK